jgi:hypothetical protein
MSALVGLTEAGITVALSAEDWTMPERRAATA